MPLPPLRPTQRAVLLAAAALATLALWTSLLTGITEASLPGWFTAGAQPPARPVRCEAPGIRSSPPACGRSTDAPPSRPAESVAQLAPHRASAV